MPMLERVFRNPPSDKESISLVVEKQHTNKAAWCFSSDSVKTEKKQDFFIFTGYSAQSNHSMAKDNLNKSKETTPTTSTALKVAP